jgi:hypothetical protein
MQLMFDLNTELGTTLVLVTHDRGIAQRCDGASRSRPALSRRSIIRGCPPPKSCSASMLSVCACARPPSPCSKCMSMPARRDARMRQFIERATEAGVRLLESDGVRLARLSGSHATRGWLPV